MPSKIAPFADMIRHMIQWQSVTESAAIDGCLMLERPCKAKVMTPIMDATFPAASMYAVLVQRGWKAVQHMVRLPGDASEFDGRDGVKMKWYYKSLINEAETVRLAGGRFRSTEPIGFVKAILMGIAISPGQPATVYRDAITDHHRTKGEAPLPLDDAVWDDDDGPDAAECGVDLTEAEFLPGLAAEPRGGETDDERLLLERTPTMLPGAQRQQHHPRYAVVASV